MEMLPNSLTLTVKEAAAALGVSRNKVYDLVAEKRIPFIRLGRLIKIPRRGLEMWLESESLESHTGVPGAPVSVVSSPQQRH